MAKKQSYPPVDKSKLLPKDKKIQKWLEKGGRPGGYEDFLKLLKLVSTPLPKQKSSKASRKQYMRSRKQPVI